jgi:hypothetical protein
MDLYELALRTKIDIGLAACLLLSSNTTNCLRLSYEMEEVKAGIGMLAKIQI